MDEDELPDIASLRVAVQIADAGSLAGAGRRSGVSASAVGKVLARLEVRLGARLFHRNTRSLTPTEDGAAMLLRARRILAEAEALREELASRDEAPRGRLRLSLPIVGEPFLGVLAAFTQRYPGIELDIEFSDRRVDVITEGFDAAVRSGGLADSSLMATALGSFSMVLAASPAYLASYGAPVRPAELRDHRCIGYRLVHSGRIGAWPLGEWNAAPLSYTVVCNDLQARVAFAVAGSGIAPLPDFAIADHLRGGRLIRVLPKYSDVVPVTLIWPSSRGHSPKMRAFSEHMADELRPRLRQD